MFAVKALASSEIAALLAITLAAAALRLSTIGAQSFGFDEAFGAAHVLDGSLGHLFAQLPRSESSPPLHYLLAWLWSKPFGLDEVSLRSLSALAGTALVPVTWAAARELGARSGALIAAALVAFNPFLLWYGQEARAYALVSLMAGISFWAFTRVLSERTPRRLAVWALVSALAVTSHYFAAFVVVPEAVWLIASSTRFRGAALAAAAFVGAVGAALLPLALSQADGRTEWISGEPLGTRARGVASKFLLGEIDPTSDAVLLVGVAALLGVLTWAVLHCRPGELGGAKVALGVGASAILLPTCLDVAGLHYLLAKNVIAALPVLAVAAGAVLGAGRGSVGRAGAAVLCAAWLAIAVAMALDPRLQRFDFRSAARAIDPELRTGVVVVASSPAAAVLELYMPGTRTPDPQGTLASEIVLVNPLRRRDAHTDGRGPTPAAPTGFVLAGRRDMRTYTLIRYRAPGALRVGMATAQQLAPATAGSRPTLLERPTVAAPG